MNLSLQNKNKSNKQFLHNTLEDGCSESGLILLFIQMEKSPFHWQVGQTIPLNVGILFLSPKFFNYSTLKSCS